MILKKRSSMAQSSGITKFFTRKLGGTGKIAQEKRITIIWVSKIYSSSQPPTPTLLSTYFYYWIFYADIHQIIFKMHFSLLSLFLVYSKENICVVENFLRELVTPLGQIRNILNDLFLFGESSNLVHVQKQSKELVTHYSLSQIGIFCIWYP